MGVLAVDLGGSRLRLAWCSKETPAKLKSQRTIEWRTQGFPLQVDTLIDLLRTYLRQCENDCGSVEAIGIAVAAVIDHNEGTIKVGENLGWRNIPLRSYLERELSRPVRVDVDAFCGALAEAQLGSGADQKHFLFVVIGTGIGHAFVLNQRIWRGVHGAANVFGHLKLGRDTIPCYCGGTDCICQYASGQGIARLARQQLPSTQISGEEILHALRRGEKWVERVIDSMYNALALGISHAINLLDIECIVLGGGVVQADFPDLDVLYRRLDELVYPEIRPIILRRSSLGADAVLIGAGLLAIE